MRNYRIHYTNIVDRTRRCRVIEALNEEEARIYFYNNYKLERDNLLDYIEEAESAQEIGVEKIYA